MDVTASELALHELLHHPAVFMEFITPVDDKGTTVLPFRDWFAADHWGQTRLYQLPSLGWDHMLSSSVPIDAGGLGIDRVALGTVDDCGGRNTSKSFGLVHDVLQDALVRPGEQCGITSRDANHLTKRLEELWKYRYHPFCRPLIVRARRGEPYSIIEWWNGHESIGVYEGTAAEGDNYLGTHWQRVNIDEFQLMSREAWRKMYDAKSEEGVVMRMTGVSDGRRDTPAHDVRNDPAWQRYLNIKPQYLNERVWTPGNKVRSIRAYGGVDSQGYVTNVDAGEGEPVSGVWDLAALRACVLTLAADKHKPLEARRTIRCPQVKLHARDFVDAHGGPNVELPPDRNSAVDVWLSIDVGKRRHPSVIGIWGIDKEIPHLWGMVVLNKVEYPDQAMFLQQLIRYYGVVRVGVDIGEAGGDQIVSELSRWKKKPAGLEIMPFNFSAHVEVPDLGVVVREGKRRKRDKEATKKYGLKYFTTVQLQRRIAERRIVLLYSEEMFTEFGSEVAKVTTGRFSTIPESYYGPQGDHIIDMIRVLEAMMFYHAQNKQQKRRKFTGVTIGRLGKM